MDLPTVCPKCNKSGVLHVPKKGYSFAYCGQCAWIGPRAYESETTKKIIQEMGKKKK